MLTSDEKEGTCSGYELANLVCRVCFEVQELQEPEELRCGCSAQQRAPSVLAISESDTSVDESGRGVCTGRV